MENQHINESILSEEILEDQKKNRIDHMKYMPGMEDIGSEILDQVVDAMHAYDYDKYTAADVKQAIAHSSRTPEDFAALLSPAALPFIEEIAQAAQIETRKHFGNSVYMFTPIYIANYCENYCIYCGFNCHNKIKRAQEPVCILRETTNRKHRNPRIRPLCRIWILTLPRRRQRRVIRRRASVSRDIRRSPFRQIRKM